MEIYFKFFPQSFKVCDFLCVGIAFKAETGYHFFAFDIPKLDNNGFAVYIILDGIEVFRNKSIGIKRYNRISAAAVHLLYVFDLAFAGENEYAGVVRRKGLKIERFAGGLMGAEIVENGMREEPRIIIVYTAVVIGINENLAAAISDAGVEHLYTTENYVPDIRFKVEGIFVGAVSQAAEAIFVFFGGIEAYSGIACGNAVESGYVDNIVLAEQLESIVNDKEHILCGKSKPFAVFSAGDEIVYLLFRINAYH